MVRLGLPPSHFTSWVIYSLYSAMFQNHHKTLPPQPILCFRLIHTVLSATVSLSLNTFDTGVTPSASRSWTSQTCSIYCARSDKPVKRSKDHPCFGHVSPALKTTPKSSMSKGVPLDSGYAEWGHDWWLLLAGSDARLCSIAYMVNGMYPPFISEHNYLVLQLRSNTRWQCAVCWDRHLRHLRNVFLGNVENFASRLHLLVTAARLYYVSIIGSDIGKLWYWPYRKPFCRFSRRIPEQVHCLMEISSVDFVTRLGIVYPLRSETTIRTFWG